MNLERGEIILLDNGKEFIILDEIEDNNSVYLFLMSNYKPLEIKMLKKKSEGDQVSLETFNDPKLKEKLMRQMQEKII